MTDGPNNVWLGLSRVLLRNNAPPPAHALFWIFFGFCLVLVLVFTKKKKKKVGRRIRGSEKFYCREGKKVKEKSPRKDSITF